MWCDGWAGVQRCENRLGSTLSVFLTLFLISHTTTSNYSATPSTSLRRNWQSICMIHCVYKDMANTQSFYRKHQDTVDIKKLHSRLVTDPLGRHIVENNWKLLNWRFRVKVKFWFRTESRKKKKKSDRTRNEQPGRSHASRAGLYKHAPANLHNYVTVVDACLRTHGGLRPHRLHTTLCWWLVCGTTDKIT